MKPSSGKVHRRLHLLPYLLALPIVLYEGVFIVSPIAQGIYGSFTRIDLGSGKPQIWVGLANYARMFADDLFWQALKNTLTISAMVIIVALVAALATALLFNRPFRFRAGARALMMIPWAFPEVPVVMIFIWILSPQFGVANVIARLIPGVTENPMWLQDSNLAIGSVVLISAWKAFRSTAWSSWPRCKACRRSCMTRQGRWRECISALPQYHPAGYRLDHRSAAGPCGDLLVQGVRSGLSPDRRRSELRDGDRHPADLQRGVPLLRLLLRRRDGHGWLCDLARDRRCLHHHAGPPGQGACLT
jgi:hypothetical protein